MRPFGFITPGRVLALLALCVIAAGLQINGGQMFSPGELSAQSRPDVTLGGISSHADLGSKCSACHVSPWSGGTMAGRCLDCHADVRRQLDAHQPLHGSFSDGMQCRNCHTEHAGAHGLLTNIAKFDHDLTDFNLTGKHTTVGCAACHVNNVFQGTAKTCAACHSEPQSHKDGVRSGRFGADCAQCHSTSTWRGAALHNHVFPLDHHHKKQPLSCVTCHTTANEFKSYTCYGCHAHEPGKMERKHARLNVAELALCTRCHPTGREHKGDRGRDREWEEWEREQKKLERDLERLLKQGKKKDAKK